MDDILNFLRWPATPLWIMALALVVALVKCWPAIMARINESRRDAAQIADTLLDRLERRVKALEDENEECRHSLAAAERRIAALEGYNDGRGNARQEAAGVAALDRLADRKKPDA